MLLNFIHHPPYLIYVYYASGKMIYTVNLILASTPKMRSKAFGFFGDNKGKYY